MNAEQLKKHFFTNFTKLHGLSLPSAAIVYLLEIFQIVPESEVDETLQYIIDSYQQQDVSSTLVEVAILQRVVAGLMKDQTTTDPITQARRFFEVISAFEIPRLKYNAERRTFFQVSNALKLHDTPALKAEFIRDRFDLVKQRLLRSAILASTNKLKITAIESLVGTRTSCFVFGMLSQLKEGRCFLEEPDASIELDLSKINTSETRGLFTETCFVLAEGIYRDGVFKVNSIAMPPAEVGAISRSMFGHINFTGGRIVETEAVLSDIENDAQEAMVVILSDVWLNRPKVMESLRLLFAGFADDPPLAFVFLGNFSSEPFAYNGADSSRYTDNMNALADLIAEFPTLARAVHFVFVPGPNDPGLSSVLPRAPIPDIFTERVRLKVTKATFTSNPCRVRFCTKELVFFREDMMIKMRRNCVLTPSSADMKTHLVKTLFDQSHLCPLPLPIRPIYWAYDHALRLYPLPHALILADQYEQYTVQYNDTQCLNPGPFGASEFAFLVYYPATNRIDPSKVSLGNEV